MSGTTFVSVDQSGAGTTSVIAAQTGKAHKVRGGFLVLSAVGTLKFSDGTTDLSGAMSLDQKSGFVLPAAPSDYFKTAVGEPLQIITTGGAAKGCLVVVTE